METIAEEIVASYEPFNNGAGPLWCYGSPTLTRDGERVFCSVPQVVPGAKPLCNTRWQLFVRRDGEPGFRLVQAGPAAAEREPCPLARLGGGRILLSINPKVRYRETWNTGESWACHPHLLQFDVGAPDRLPQIIEPVWDQDYEFTEHSYRGIAADAIAGEVLLLNIVGHEGQAWSFLEQGGSWAYAGLIRFPLRACYPHVALVNRAAYILAVSDVVEPNLEWRTFKRRVTGNEWDYDFRQLYFTWTPDIATTPFSPILTIATVDETCGHIRNLDLWIGPDGDAHVLWLERNVWHAFMRDVFFPGLPITVALKYARVRRGEVVERCTLERCEEDVNCRQGAAFEPIAPGQTADVPMRDPRPTCAAFHTPDGVRAMVVYHLVGERGINIGCFVRQVVPSLPDKPVSVQLEHPLHTFFTATVRNGTQPSPVIDLFGLGAEPNMVRYAQLRLADD
ncbi:MAG: hypothetical protein RMN25_06145 [Anaerolineae bacterium]|nr:hypothetical protein [Thermoflexales bacterium]MDW8407348.1 hypothetical protein [Anaerolineae bacterium]